MWRTSGGGSSAWGSVGVVLLTFCVQGVAAADIELIGMILGICGGVVLLILLGVLICVLCRRPSKDKTAKADVAPSAAAPSSRQQSNRQQQQKQQLQQKVPAQVPPGVWTANPTMFAGAPAAAYQYQNGGAPQPGYANGQPIGRHFTSEPALNQSPGVRRPAPAPGRGPPPGRGARGQPPPARAQANPYKPTPFKVSKLGPPPNLKEIQGGDITLDPETIKLRNSQIRAFDTQKSATARVFVNDYQEEMTSSNQRPAGGKRYSAHVYSDYPDPKDSIGPGAAHAYNSGQSSSISGSASGTRDPNSYIQSDWNINYGQSGYFLPNKDGGYTKVSSDALPPESSAGSASGGSGAAGGGSGGASYTNPYSRKSYGHGVFIARRLSDAGSIPEGANVNKRLSVSEARRQYEDLDEVTSTRLQNQPQSTAASVKRSVSDVSHLRRSGAPPPESLNEAIYARPDKALKRQSSRNSAAGVQAPTTPSSPEPPPVPPPPPLSPSTSTTQPAHHQTTLDAVRQRREQLQAKRQISSSGLSTIGYANEGANVIAETFGFLDEFDDET